MGTGVSPSHSIVTQVATAEGVSPTALEPPLHAVIDPDALESIVESGDETLTIEFGYRDQTVSVDGTGSVTVQPANQSADSTPNVDSTEDAAGD